MMGTKTAVSHSRPHIQLRLDSNSASRRYLPFIWLALLLLAAILLPDRIWNTLLVGFGGLFLIAYLWVRLLANGLLLQDAGVAGTCGTGRDPG